MVFGCLCATVAELSSHDWDSWSAKPKIFIIWLFTKITYPCPKCPGPRLEVEAAIAEMFFRCGKTNSWGEVMGMCKGWDIGFDSPGFWVYAYLGSVLTIPILELQKLQLTSGAVKGVRGVCSNVLHEPEYIHSVALASYALHLSPLMIKSMLLKSLHLSSEDRKTKNGPHRNLVSFREDLWGGWLISAKDSLLGMDPTLKLS